MLIPKRSCPYPLFQADFPLPSNASEQRHIPARVPPHQVAEIQQQDPQPIHVYPTIPAISWELLELR